MSKGFLVCAALLISSRVFAAERAPGAPGGSHEKMICYYMNYMQCSYSSSACVWDYNDNRCEPLPIPGGQGACGNFFDPYSCNAQSAFCVWDYPDNRCEELPH